MRYYYRYNVCPQCGRGDTDLLAYRLEPWPVIFNMVVPSGWRELECIRTNDQLLQYFRSTRGRIVDEVGREFTFGQFVVLVRDAFRYSDILPQDLEGTIQAKYASAVVQFVGDEPVIFMDFVAEGLAGV